MQLMEREALLVAQPTSRSSSEPHESSLLERLVEVVGGVREGKQVGDGRDPNLGKSCKKGRTRTVKGAETRAPSKMARNVRSTVCLSSSPGRRKQQEELH